ncbi:hypothetical protein PHLGIDRAFT_80828, partial [Phlebiopsis gigantea 11061_1 CR5-6]
NFVTGFLLSKGIDSNIYTIIAMYINLYTKQAHFALTTNKVHTNGIASLHICNVFQLHKLPHSIISDQGPQFTFKLIKVLYAKLIIKG